MTITMISTRNGSDEHNILIYNLMAQFSQFRQKKIAGCQGNSRQIFSMVKWLQKMEVMSATFSITICWMYQKRFRIFSSNNVITGLSLAMFLPASDCIDYQRSNWAGDHGYKRHQKNLHQVTTHVATLLINR